jgi:hypothetical protein
VGSVKFSLSATYLSAVECAARHGTDTVQYVYFTFSQKVNSGGHNRLFHL